MFDERRDEEEGARACREVAVFDEGRRWEEEERVCEEVELA